MTDFASILAEIPVYHLRPPKEIGQAEIVAKAAAMARRGYRHTEKTLEALKAYLEGYGVLLSGAVGIGKTNFFERVNPQPITLLSFNRCHLWTADQLGEWLDEHCAEEIVLDDIGWDTDKARNYGQRFETLQFVIDARLTLSKARTHVTTNLTNDELIGRYDAHLVDRIYQMCKCFALPRAESQREPRPNEIWLRNRQYEREMGKEEL